MAYDVPVRFISDDASLAKSQERVNAGFERMAGLAKELRAQQERNGESVKSLTSENKRLLNAQVDMERRFKDLPKAVQQAARAFFEYEQRITEAQRTMARLGGMTGPLSQMQGKQFARARQDAAEYTEKLEELRRTIVQVDAAQLRASTEGKLMRGGRGGSGGGTADPFDAARVAAAAKAGEVAMQRLAQATYRYQQAKEAAAAAADPFSPARIAAAAKAGEAAMERLAQATYRAAKAQASAFDATAYIRQTKRVGDALREQLIATDQVARAQRALDKARADGALTARLVSDYSRAVDNQRRAVEQLRKEEAALKKAREQGVASGRSGAVLDSAAENEWWQGRKAALEMERLADEAERASNAFDATAYVQQVKRVGDALREQLTATDRLTRAQETLDKARADGSLTARQVNEYSRALDSQRAAVEKLRQEEVALARSRARGVGDGRSGSALDSVADRARQQARAAAVEMATLNREAEAAAGAVHNALGPPPQGLLSTLNDLSFKLFVITFAAKQMFDTLLHGFVQVGEEVLLFEQRVQALTKSKDAIEPLFDVATDLGVAIQDVSQGFTRFAVANTVMKRTQKELVDMTDTVLKFGLVSGSSMQEATAGLQQLGQGLASNRLQGDELRSVMENLPLLAVELGNQLGIGVAGLREWGSQGELTGKVVSDAILKAKDTVDKLYADLPDTTTRALARVGNEWARFIAEIQRDGNGMVVLFNDMAHGLALLRQFVVEHSDAIAIALKLATAAGLAFLGVFLGRQLTVFMANIIAIGSATNALPPAFALAEKRAKAFTGALVLGYTRVLPILGAVGFAIYALADAFGAAEEEAKSLKDQLAAVDNDLTKLAASQLRVRRTNLNDQFSDDLVKLEQLGNRIDRLRKRIAVGVQPETPGLAGSGYSERDLLADQQRLDETEMAFGALTDALAAIQKELNEVNKLLGQTPEKLAEMEQQAKLAKDLAGAYGDEVTALLAITAQMSLIARLQEQGRPVSEIVAEVEALKQRQQIERETLKIMEESTTIEYAQAKAIVKARIETERAIEAALEQKEAKKDETEAINAAREAWKKYGEAVKDANTEYEDNIQYFTDLRKKVGFDTPKDNVQPLDVSAEIIRARQKLVDGDAEGAVTAAKKAGALIEKYIDEHDGVVNFTAKQLARRAADVGKMAAEALKKQRILDAEEELKTVDKVRVALEALFGREWRLKLGLDLAAIPAWAVTWLSNGGSAPPARGVGADGVPWVGAPPGALPPNIERGYEDGVPSYTAPPPIEIERGRDSEGAPYFSNPGLGPYGSEPIDVGLIVRDGQSQIAQQIGTPDVPVRIVPQNDVAQDVGEVDVATRLNADGGVQQIQSQVGVITLPVRLEVTNPEIMSVADAAGGRNPNSTRARA